MLSAWGDESGSNRVLDPGAYLLGAVILDASQLEKARERLQSLLMPGQRKVHWVEESDRRRNQLVSVVSELKLPGLVVTRVAGLAEREERRRRKCLNIFAYKLSQLGCASVTLESRGKKADDRDLAFVESQVDSGSLNRDFKVFHVPGPNDPLLWAADIAVGAAVAARTGNPQWFNQLKDGFRTVIIDES